MVDRAMTGTPISVLIVDDHPGWRETLRRILGNRGGFLVEEAEDGETAIETARSVRPDVVLMDVDLPTIDGIETTRRILSEQPGANVLMLSGFDERETVAAAESAGASGYLVKTAGSAQIVDCIRRVGQGERVFPSLVAGGAVDPDDPDPRVEALSESELSVLALIAEGRSNPAVAEALSMSLKTVEARISSIFGKLGLEPSPVAHRRVLAARAYLRWQETRCSSRTIGMSPLSDSADD
jgi:DNA-binding NarL/FixJ family response regulator